MSFHLKRRIRDFILGNTTFRRIKLIYSKTIRPLLVKFIFAAIILAVVISTVVKIYNPKLAHNLTSKAYQKFFHLLNSGQANLRIVNIYGNLRISKEEIVRIVNDFYIINETEIQDDYQNSIQNLIDEIQEKLPLVSQITISRTIPDILNISIIEFVPYAIWHDENHKFVIDRDGKSIDYRPEYEDIAELKNMLILSGKNANLHAKSLFNLISTDPVISDEIYSANWVGGRRWDLRFNSGLIIKMPELEISQAWKEMKKMLEMPNASAFRVIDLRVKNKVYIENVESDSLKNESI